MKLLKKFLGKKEDNNYMKDYRNLEDTKQISSKLDDNLSYIQQKLNHPSDLQKMYLKDGKALLVYLETLSDQDKVNEKVILPLSKMDNNQIQIKNMESTGKQHTDLHEGIKQLLKGHALLFIKGTPELYTFNATAIHNRSVDEPANEKVVRGSHEGFVENIIININLIRKRIESTDLAVRYYKVGERSNTNVGVLFMQSLADPEVVKKLDERLKWITSDTIISPGYVEEFIEDTPSSPFPQMLNTERPDGVMSDLMEGRVAVMVEGSPTALILPVTLMAFYQTPDDYNGRWIAGSYLRMIRLLSFFLAVTLPAFYTAIIAFHFEFIPNDLVLPIKASIDDIAYPPILEALVMVITIELIREAGVRLPTPVGQTIGIVGGLIIGDAVVRAGLISNVMIVIIATTAIASFVVPSNEMSTTVRILIYPMILSAALLGFVGITFASMIILIHLCKLESFGTPYFSPWAPLKWNELKDTFIRVPVWKMNQRPSDTQVEELNRQRESRGWKKT
ncbi:spore germination protein KA [Lentibacillus persicus]|uniref:Spore germination protein KA n=1 Tax=Lentibacillus persicus TaxID=640948 RepID=A0A1I2AWM3_9BACI|nr:spore germination protein [Lentibacillus persicus]SFE48028.1 spore germination protein KA [Lentibacillus persicus]